MRPDTRSGGEPGSDWSLQRMSWLAVERYLARDDRLLVPVGALAQHGPHLPLGTNTLIADRIASEVSRRVDVLKAPPLSYGVLAPTRVPYPGQAGLRRKTLLRMLNELLATWEDMGIRRFFLVTAYRYDAHLDALLMALSTEAVTEVVNLYSVAVSDLVDTSPVREHGGELETSMMLHLFPERVSVADIPDATPVTRSYPGRGIPMPSERSRGIVGRPDAASAEKGERLVARMVDAIAKAVGQPRSVATPGAGELSTPGPVEDDPGMTPPSGPGATRATGEERR